ncbi:spermatogenesis-associated protein [Pristimantis euphronides]
MKSLADRQTLYQDYISHYESSSYEGHIPLCDQRPEGRGDSGGHSAAALGELYSQLIRHNLQTRNPERRMAALKQMMKAFAILEVICVNLFLFPWRKEIRTLKKFTGNFVYFVEPVIPEDAIRQILQRVGYSIASDTEYIIGGNINTEEAKQTAFELYLSRIQCENLLWLMSKDRSVYVSQPVNRPDTEANTGSEQTGHTGKDTCRTTGIHETDRANLDFKYVVAGDNDTTKAADLTISHMSSQDVISDTSEKDPSSIKHIDSDDFLNKYSDLNLAQKPIFPLLIKQNKAKEWTVPISEEPNIAKAHFPGSFSRDSGSATVERQDLSEVNCGLQDENIDVRTFTDELERPKSLEAPAEVIVPTKQERVVTKLKMQNMGEESLAYPIEETLPPDSAKFSDSSDLGRPEVKWAFLKTKDGTESVVSPMSLSSDFSMLNISSKSAAWTPGMENRLREPPNSTYIPPTAPESESMKSASIKGEENHFQAPFLPGNSLLVNEFNMHEDTKEDYVMITRRDHLQN